MESYYKYHGTCITDKLNLSMLENALWFGYTVTRHERLSDGKYASRPFPINKTFYANGKLYMFLTSNNGQISDFFELNQDKEDKSHGAYYSVQLTEPIGLNNE